MRSYFYKNLLDTIRVAIGPRGEGWLCVVYFLNSTRCEEKYFDRKTDAKLWAFKFCSELYSMPRSDEEFVGWDGDGRNLWEVEP